MARQACRRKIYSILSQSDGDEASLAGEKSTLLSEMTGGKCAAAFMHLEEEASWESRQNTIKGHVN